jgi:membrane protein
MLDPLEKIQDIIWSDSLSRYGLPGRIAATSLRYIYAVARDFFSGQLTLRAMSLVYTTLLSIVPLIAFSFSLLKGFGYHKELEKYLYTLAEPLGDQGLEYAEQMMKLVNNINGSVLGGVGLGFLIFTAVSMVQKIEASFNYVWYVTKPRSFSRRFTEYVFVLLIGPLVMAIALGMITTLQNDAVVQELLHNEAIGPLFAASGKLMPFMMIIGMFTFLYWFMPNTKVNLRSALAGGVAGGFLWATVSVIFTAFIASSARTQAIYASFAIAIVTLVWLYLNWLILLVGSQLAFYHQNPEYLRNGRRDPRLSSSISERLALNAMFIIGRAFRDSNLERATFTSVSKQLKIPSLTMAPILIGLEEAGLISLTEKEELQPGRDIARIRLEEILHTVRQEGDTGSFDEPEWAPTIESIGTSIDDAVNTALDNRTLADLLDEAE